LKAAEVMPAWMSSGVLKVWSDYRDHDPIYPLGWVKRITSWARPQQELGLMVMDRWLLHDRKKGIKASEASLAEVVHGANVWMRACRYNVVVLLTPHDYDDYEVCGCLHYMGSPPQAFLDGAPGAAKFSMKTAITEHRPLMTQLLTPEERAGVVTPADREAYQAYRRAGSRGHYDFVDGAGVLSADDPCTSWVLWALDDIETALCHVAWRGAPLSSPVPAVLKPCQSSEWSNSRDEIPSIPLSLWLTNHRDWIGDAVIDLFHRARAEVVEATLTAGLAPLASDGSSFKEARGEKRMRKRGVARKEAVANVRDVVRGEPGLVKLIASFA
jgi:hypothetical protein